MFAFLKKIFGSRNDRILARLKKNIIQINQLEPELQALSLDELRARADELKQQVAAGKSLDDILAPCFALVREASVRTLGLRHFDVQLIGGMVLHRGKIAEMRTGEGKTLMATLAAVLNALSGRGVHVITVNDYLATRDAEWMSPVYTALGLSVGVIVANMSHDDKQKAYACDIVYGTNNEFGFDYLRDNMAFSTEEKVQRELNFAIVDEVDSILIDEARTPLIISGAAEDSSEMYKTIDKVIPHLVKQEEEGAAGDFTVDEKQRQAFLTEGGHQRVEELLVERGVLEPGDSLYHPSNIMLMHHIGAALRAHALFNRDVDYIVAGNEVVIVDEHTGRTMPGRRWSEGLHQAIEAKEGVKIQHENQTLASITFQNYFRLYDKLSGMTGTADTEAYEFQQIYNLEVVVIPTNKPMVRKDQVDLVYLTTEEKYLAVIEDIKDCQQRGQPVLVGTASIEASEILDHLLNKANIKHQVLNAKFHEKEAVIIAEAGRPGVVTIATNMAGRGTDIVLGGSLDAELHALGEEASEQDKAQLKQAWQQRHQQVLDAGGLRIIGSERHESRRIDNQLRGRAGRQGDPGSTRFYLSLEDNLMRIFASDRVSVIMKKLGMEKGEAIEHSLVTRAIENAQRKVEGHNFDIRKQLLDYDNVANDQRQVIYQQRSDIMSQTDIRETIINVMYSVFDELISEYIPPESIEEQWDITGLEQRLSQDFALTLSINRRLEEDNEFAEEDIRKWVLSEAMKVYEAKEQEYGRDIFSQLEKSLMLQVLDKQWREHLAAMDHLRQGIHLRGYAQKDPKQEYKREAFALFSSLLDNLKIEVISLLFTVQIKTADDVDSAEVSRREDMPTQMNYLHDSVDGMGQAQDDDVPSLRDSGHVEPFVRSGPKIGRNEPCPCGSGKKYKSCHGRIA